jgi:V8-like Glu-specific endopeptidase
MFLSICANGIAQPFLCDPSGREAGPRADLDGYEISNDIENIGTVSLLSHREFTGKDLLKKSALIEQAQKRQSPAGALDEYVFPATETFTLLPEWKEDKLRPSALSIISREDQKFLLQQVLEENKKNPIPPKTLETYLADESCDAIIRSEYIDAERHLLKKFPKPALYIKSYLGDRVEFKNDKIRSLGIVGDYISKAQAVLKNCYSAAEKSAFVKDHRLLERLGTITNGDAVCTAFGFGGDRHLLTARHCFTDKRGLPSVERGQIFFSPAGSEEKYQVCSVLGNDALGIAQTAILSRDQVVVTVAPMKKKFPITVMFKSSELVAVSSARKSNATRLAQISYFPLASLLLPHEFPSGFVTNESCVPLKTSSSCFSHLCSTVKGGSGSPIFSADSPRLELIGTHIGFLEENKDACTQVGGPVNAAAYPQQELEDITNSLK